MKDYSTYHVWMGYLNEIRHDVIAKQNGAIATEEEIQAIGEMIYYLKNFAQKSRNNGLLAMEGEAENLNQEIFREKLLFDATRFICDGWTKESILEVLSNYYWIRRPEGYMATAIYIAIRGAILIQEQANPYYIQQVVSSILPEEIQEKCIAISDGYAEVKRKKKVEEARTYFETDFSKTESFKVREVMKFLEREICCMTDEEVQRLLRETENTYLVQAMLGMREDARQAIIRNMSSRLQEMILLDFYESEYLDEVTIVESADYVSQILQRLQSCGEIKSIEETLKEIEILKKILSN